MSEFNLSSMNIFTIGDALSDSLRDCGVSENAELTIYVNEEEFKMVDEDLFYRNRKVESEKFVPSEGEIDITFKGVNMIIKKKSGK